MSKRSLCLFIAVLVFTKAHAPESSGSATPFAAQTPTIAMPVLGSFAFAALNLDLDEYALGALEFHALIPASLDIATQPLFPWEDAARTYFAENHSLTGDPLIDEGELRLSLPLATSSIASGIGGTSRSRPSRGQVVASTTGGSVSSSSSSRGSKSASSSTSTSDTKSEDERVAAIDQRGEPPQDTPIPASPPVPNGGAEPNDGANDTVDDAPNPPVNTMPPNSDGDSSVTPSDDAPDTTPATPDDGEFEEGAAPPGKPDIDQPEPFPIWKDPPPSEVNPPNVTTPVPVPLPGSLPLFAAGLAVLGWCRLRRKSRRPV